MCGAGVAIWNCEWYTLILFAILQGNRDLEAHKTGDILSSENII